MGGSSDDETNGARNLIVLCSYFNGAIERNEDAANTARIAGWKLRPWESLDRPVLDRWTQSWWSLDDDFGRQRWN